MRTNATNDNIGAKSDCNTYICHWQCAANE